MKTLFIDMDGVLCDYQKAYNECLINNPERQYPQSQTGFFLFLEPIIGSIQTVNELKHYYDINILTRPSYMNLHCFTEKALWIKKHFGQWLVDKIYMAPDKSKIIGDYLIDDSIADGQANFVGEHIHFGTEKFKNWILVEKYLKNV